MTNALSDTIEKINRMLSAESVLFLVGYKTNGVEQKGSTLRSYCPIHREEMIRSLVIDTARSTFRCMYSGCRGHRGGTFFQLYQLAKGLDEATAARELAGELGLKLDPGVWEDCGTDTASPPETPPANPRADVEAELKPMRGRLEDLQGTLAARERDFSAGLEGALAEVQERLGELERNGTEERARLEQLAESLARESQQRSRLFALADELPALRERLERLAGAVTDAAGRRALEEMARDHAQALEGLRAELATVRETLAYGEPWSTLTARVEALSQELSGLVEARAQLAARVDGLADSMTSIAGAGRDAQLVSESLGGVIRRLEEVWTRLDRLEEQLAALTRQGARRPASPADADRPANRIAYL